MDEKRDRGRFMFDLEKWAARWPSMKWEAKHAAAYWMVLQFFSFEDAVAGLDRAAQAQADSDFTRQKIPPADTVREYAARAERERKRTDLESKALAAAEEDARREHNPAPDDPKRQAEWIAEADDFEALARKWQAQSKRLGLDVGKSSPIEVNRERMDEFKALWKSKGLGAWDG